MRSLHEQGYRSMLLSEVLSRLAHRRALPDNAVVITFDDGYQSVYAEAFPALQQYGFTATVFLITGYCGKFNDWPGHTSPVGRRLLSWNEIRAMHRYGFEFGSHTVTHPDLTAISAEEADREIRVSKTSIQEHLGEAVKTFAYPYGKYSREVVEIVREQFVGACSADLGKATAGDHPHLLRRIDMYYLSTAAALGSISTRYLDWYLGLRQAGRYIRQRLP